jgi:hypothetical protein
MATNIPISFKQQQPQSQGYQQSSPSQWRGGQERYSPQQQQGMKEGMFQQPSREQFGGGQQFGYGSGQQFGQQQQPYGQQQQQQWRDKQGEQPRDEQGGISGLWEKVKETFTPQSYESGGQTYGGQRESGTQMGIGNWVTKDLRVNDVSVADLTELHLLLLFAGECYIKEHILMKLSEDRQGLVKQWHQKVTINNLNQLCNLAQKWGVTLPCARPLEQREHEIKNRLQNVGPILTDVEVLKDLKCSACSLEQQLARAFFLSHNEDMKNTAQSLCHNACDQVSQLKQALCQQPDYFPVPIVKTIVCKEGVHDRK